MTMQERDDNKSESDNSMTTLLQRMRESESEKESARVRAGSE